MTGTKGVAAPFFLARQVPARRPDALLAQAVSLARDRRWGEAIILAEAACRMLPQDPMPAILRATILDACSPGKSTSAWTAAWERAPLDASLQDQFVASLLRSGRQDAAIEVGLLVLPSRSRAGNDAPLVQMLESAGVSRCGACWKDGAALEIRCHPSAQHRIVVSTTSGDAIHETASDGSLRVEFGKGILIEAVAFEGGPRLGGTPVAFSSARSSMDTEPVADGVDIIIPVFRDFAGVRECIDSVLSSLAVNRTAARVLVVNDASPEMPMVLWLERLAASQRIRLMHNRFNLGFIETVNSALGATRGHALVLNSDTRVHGDWIDRLVAALHRARDVASVMPWSNNGEIGSIVEGGTPAPSADTIAQVDGAIAALHASGAVEDVEVPTNSGYALLMRREAIDEVGAFDGEWLRRGYLEEVDWCLRARAAGWRHTLATGVFVAHKGSASFGIEKRLRVRENRSVISARYPSYYEEYASFLRGRALRSVRDKVRDSLQPTGWPQSRNEEPPAIDPALRLPVDCERVAVRHPEPGTPEASLLLALARHMATDGERGGAKRLLVFGAASETLWHTGVVDVVPPPAAGEHAVIDDATLASFAGCSEALPVRGSTT